MESTELRRINVDNAMREEKDACEADESRQEKKRRRYVQTKATER